MKNKFLFFFLHFFHIILISQCMSKTVVNGEIWVVPETISLASLIIEEGGSVVAFEGCNITLTVNGIETGQDLLNTSEINTKIQPGTYFGDVIISITLPNQQIYNGLTFNFRQALSIKENGFAGNESVVAAIQKGSYGDNNSNNLLISSTGQCFNGIFVSNRNYSIDDANIHFIGNGRCDFIGYASAITVTGSESRVVINRVHINNTGVVRTAIVADNGANLIVKNSFIHTSNGQLPSDYFPTVNTVQMRSAPWMLGISGNVRATNLLGTNTKASYINSYIGSEGWGVLSTDGCQTPTLTSINNIVEITGEDGYGTYGLGNAVEYILGSTLNVGTYSTISRDSTLYYGNSEPSLVEFLNNKLDIGLSEDELTALAEKNTVVNSRRFGIMFQGGGSVFINGSTIFNTEKTIFLNKGQSADITIDGFYGVELNSKSNVIYQLMDNDDPGETVPEMINNNTYIQPNGSASKVSSHSIYSISTTDSVLNLLNIKIIGDFYNGMRGDQQDSTSFGLNPRNLGLTLHNASIIGVITASTAVHFLDSINSTNYRYLGEVNNTPTESVNNGVMVSLRNYSFWSVTRLCYLSGLYVEKGSKIQAANGKILIFSVNGTETDLDFDTSYLGNIVVSLSELEEKNGFIRKFEYYAMKQGKIK